MDREEKAKSIIRRMDALASARSLFEPVWRDVADFFLPQQASFMRGGYGRTMTGLEGLMGQMPATRQPGSVKRRFDSTPLLALDRLASGMDGLISPQNEIWQDLRLDDPLGMSASHEEKDWLQRLLRFVFRVRYNPVSGWTTANPKAIRSACAFAVGIVYVEDGYTSAGARPGALSPIVYSHIPLSSAYLGVDAYDNVDTLYRQRGYSPRALAQRFGEDALSDKTKAHLRDERRMDVPIPVIHAVHPRSDFNWDVPRDSTRNSDFESVWLEAETQHVMAAGGYHEFPYAVSYWQQGEETAYGDSPCTLALSDAMGLNIMRKTMLRSAQQWVDPPLAVNHEGMLNRPSLNPGTITPGAIDANGRPKIQPIMTGGDPMRANALLEVERQSIYSALYVDLFQMLAQQRPGETATAVLVRAEEKSNLLGPNGANLSAGHSRMMTRELGILSRLGLYRQGSPLAPPDSMRGRSFAPKSATPLDKLREKRQLQAALEVAQVVVAVGQAIQVPHVGDKLDGDAIIDLAVETGGAPQNILRSPEALKAVRDAAAQAAQQQQQAALAESMGRTAKDAVPALQGLQSMQDQGQLPAPGGEMPAGAMDGGMGSLAGAFAQQ